MWLSNPYDVVVAAHETSEPADAPAPRSLHDYDEPAITPEQAAHAAAALQHYAD
jgi:hypothetical protein